MTHLNRKCQRRNVVVALVMMAQKKKEENRGRNQLILFSH
jgi:hypothetical protein